MSTSHHANIKPAFSATRRATLAVLALALTVQPVHAALPAPTAPTAPLTVHEWGTFTSMQGSDGITLEGLHHEEEPLPDFVHSQMSLRPARANAGAPTPVPSVPAPRPPHPRPPHWPRPTKGLDVDVTGVTQKMETPVIYFHTTEAQHVTVKVDFQRGLLTQWYPATSAVTPVQSDSAGPLDLAKIESSSLTWDGDVIPASAGALAVPAVDASDPWAFAREVDAAGFRTFDATGRGQTESEKYLFYRGLGTFTLPVNVEALADGSTVVANGGADALPVAFAVDVTADTARFVRLGAVAAGSRATVSLASTPFAAKAGVMERLGAAVTADLEAQGLFADEARAMVRTWARQWFGTPGTRILYLVPRAVIDRVLPLSITPTPAKLTRVLLGRLEYMTQATEASVTEALTNRLSSDPAVRAAAEQHLAGLGRFLEAHVRRAQARTADPAIQKSAAEVLAAGQH